MPLPVEASLPGGGWTQFTGMRPFLLFTAVAGLGWNFVCGAPVWPTAGWMTSTPDEQGLDRAALEAFSAELAGTAHGYIDSMLVIRNGRVAFQRSYPRDYEEAFNRAPEKSRDPCNYYDPIWHPFYRGTELHTLQSISKSVTATLIGIAIRRGEDFGPRPRRGEVGVGTLANRPHPAVFRREEDA